MKTITEWKKEHEFDSYLGEHTISVDGKRQAGFNPKALLLTGLAACSGIDVVDILEKMRVTISGFTIITETEQTEEHPRVFKDILLTFQVNTAMENEDKIRKAIDLSLEKYCGVSAMLGKNSKITYKLEIKSS
ncbi:MAG: OsmC family protein [Chitinophagaceae bacterium]|jgi:putative redox protein|nr:OsmC family protein [Chitinophagaceae bacterium]